MRIFTNETDFYSEADAMVYTSGYEECEKGHAYGPTYRKSYMIHYITYDQGTYICEDQMYHLKKGDAFLIRPKQKIYYEADQKDPWAYAWVGMQGTKIPYYLNKTTFIDTPVVHIDGNDLNFILLKLNEAYHLSSVVRDLMLTSVLYELLAFFCEHFPKPQTKQEDYIHEIMTYVMAHLDEPIKINTLANEIGIDRSYMTRLFKAQCQCSLKDYITNAKLDEAKKLLKTTDLKIHAIAAMVGFDDELYFSRWFREHVNLTASQYRKKEKNHL